MRQKRVWGIGSILFIIVLPCMFVLWQHPLFSHATSGTSMPLPKDEVNVVIKAYGYPDNDDGNGHTGTAAIAYPRSAGYPTLHDGATEGTGTYDDPITFAAYTPLTEGNHGEFLPGSRIYVPYLKKYFILEDQCGDCNQGLNTNKYLLHLWLGPSTLTAQDTAQSIEDCETKIAQATTPIVINPAASANYPVEQTPLYSQGNCTAKIFSTDSGNPAPIGSVTATPTLSPTASVAPCNDSTCTGPTSDGQVITVAITSYGYPDNDDGNGHYGTAVIAYPHSDGYPTLHDSATEGTGTYADPITFAAYNPDTEGQDAPFPPGERIYVPYLHKYFMLEDQCADCDQGKNGLAYHIDLWMGPDTSDAMQYSQSILDCEDSITHDSEDIIVNPTADHTVDTTPLFGNGTCSAQQYSS